MNKLKILIENKGTPFYLTDLEKLLDSLGIAQGDKIIAHVSLSSFGYLVGGEQTIIEGIMHKIGKNGTLIFPAQSVELMNPESWQYPPVPEEWYVELRNSILPYDPLKTDVSPGLGKVANYFCKYPGVVRSNHPLYSFAAIGKESKIFMSKHDLDFGLGPNSPLGTMYKSGTKVLMLGTNFESNTSIHLAEYFLNRQPFWQEAPMIVNEKKEWVRFQDIDLDIYDDFLDIQNEFIKSNPITYKEVLLNNGLAMVFDMKECVDFVIEYYRRRMYENFFEK